jgi:hypothetical protein
LLSFPRLLEQSQPFFQWQLDPGFPYHNPDTIDSGLKLNFATGPNIVQIGNRFWERHLQLAGHPTHNPYFRKESFLVKLGLALFCGRRGAGIASCCGERAFGGQPFIYYESLSVRTFSS